MKRRFGLTLCGLFLAAGCATFTGGGSHAQRSEAVTLVGTIEAIDTEQRLFKVSGDDLSVVLRAGPDLRNFNRMEVGDRVTLEYYEAMAVGIADPEDPGTGIGEVMIERAPEEAKPGMKAFESLATVVEFLSYSDETHIAVVRTESGETQRVLVPQEMRAFAAERRPGSRIVLVVDRALAIAVTPAE